MCYPSCMQPDVMVLAHDRPQVDAVVEVRLHVHDPRRLAVDLQQYMESRRCRIGILVSKTKTRIYGRPMGYGVTDPLEPIAVVPTSDLLGEWSRSTRQDAQRERLELERAVLAWLDRLTTASPLALPENPRSREAIARFVLPAVADGRVVAGA